MLDDDLRVQSANEVFFTMFQVTASETEGQLFFDLGSGTWDKLELRRLLTEVLPERKTMENFQVEQGLGTRQCVLMPAALTMCS